MLMSNTMDLHLTVKAVHIKLQTKSVLRTIYWYTIMGSHLTAIFVNTRTIPRMVSIVTSRMNTKD